MTFVDLIGWIAAAFTLAAYSMRTMLPLRIAAICANISFATYGWLEGALSILTLHLVLLPFNLYRLEELLRGLRRLRRERHSSEFSWLRTVAKPKSFAAGQKVFRKGDRPDYLYFIDEGEVLLDEIDVVLGEGEVLGEIAFFTDARERTVSATCRTPCRIFVIDEAQFLLLYHQNPSFGFAIAKLISKRLLDGIERRPEVYRAIHDGGGEADAGDAEEVSMPKLNPASGTGANSP